MNSQKTCIIVLLIVLAALTGCERWPGRDPVKDIREIRRL